MDESQKTLTSNDLPLEQLAAMADDDTIIYFSVIPLVILGILAIVWFILYTIRKKKSWEDMGAALREEGATMKTVDDNFPDDQQLQGLKETVPSKELQDGD